MLAVVATRVCARMRALGSGQGADGCVGAMICSNPRYRPVSTARLPPSSPLRAKRGASREGVMLSASVPRDLEGEDRPHSPGAPRRARPRRPALLYLRYELGQRPRTRRRDVEQGDRRHWGRASAEIRRGR